MGLVKSNNNIWNFLIHPKPWNFYNNEQDIQHFFILFILLSTYCRLISLQHLRSAGINCHSLREQRKLNLLHNRKIQPLKQ